MNLKTKQVISTTTGVSLSADDMRGLLRLAGVEVPDNAEVAFRIPGGGDWSNTTLDVDDGELFVSWEVTEVKE